MKSKPPLIKKIFLSTMQSFRHSALSSRVAPKLKSVHPKDKLKQWNIVTGDKVNLQPFLSF